MINTRLLLVLTISIVGCSANQHIRNAPLIVDAGVESAYTNYKASMQKIRPPLEFGSTQVATNCREYLTEKTASSISENTSNFFVAQRYVICDTLNAIHNSANNRISIEVDKVAKELLARLDLRSFRSSLFQRTDDVIRTLEDVAPGSVSVSNYSARAALDDWEYVVKVVAFIDADDNGVEDWLVWVKDKAGTGSYDSLNAYIAYNVRQNGLIELTAL